MWDCVAVTCPAEAWSQALELELTTAVGAVAVQCSLILTGIF